jgi:hypothetical protein
VYSNNDNNDDDNIRRGEEEEKKRRRRTRIINLSFIFLYFPIHGFIKSEKTINPPAIVDSSNIHYKSRRVD